MYFQELSIPWKIEVNYNAVTIKCNLTNLTIVSIYVPPGVKLSVQQWNDFITLIPKPFIISRDLNAHNIAWRNQYTDTRGKILLDVLDRNNLIFMNDGSPTLVNSASNGICAIDLTICTPDIFHLIKWETVPDPHCSNHLPILISIALKPPSVTNTRNRKWNVSKADWTTYATQPNLNLDDHRGPNYTDFIGAINNAAKNSIPEYRNKAATTKNKEWWNEQCQTAVTIRRNCFQQYKENPNLQNLMQYKRSDAVAKRTLKEAKKESWRKYCVT